MPTFTPEQILALSCENNVSVRANAGSGKTTVLAHRVARLLALGKAEIGGIVCITFTTNAAAEMRKRIHAIIQDFLHGADNIPLPPNTNRDRACDLLRKAQAELGTSRICTFHALCASIIRDFAYHKEMSSDVRDVEEREASVLRKESVLESIASRLATLNDARKQLLLLYDIFSVDELQQSLQQIIASNMAVERFAQLRNEVDESNVHAVASQRAALSLMSYVAPFIPVFQTIRSQLKPLFSLCTADVQKNITGVEDFLASWKESDVKGLCDSFNDASIILGVLYTNAGTQRKKVKDLPVGIALPDVSDKLTKAPPLSEESIISTEVSEVQNLYYLSSMVQEASARYADKKRTRNGIDFDDMITLAIELMKKPAVAAQFRLGVKYLMIDEFQDTNPAQFDFVRLICQTTDGAPVRDVNLFVVGDPKQGIYGFRDADIRMYKATEQFITSMNEHNGLQGSSVLELPDSFRMAPRLVDDLNKLFVNVFNGDGEYEVDYSQLGAGRTSNFDTELGTMRFVNLDSSAAESDIEDEDDDSVAVTASEFQHAVSLLKEIFANDSLWRVEREVDGVKQLVKPQPSDVAILVRKRNSVAQALQVLREADIPCTSIGSRDFFSRPEIADIRNLLIWCNSPTNDLALLCLLRSPLFEITDSDLYDVMCGKRKDISAWELFNLCCSNGVASGQVVQAIYRLTSFLQLCKAMSVGRFILIALSQSNWHQHYGSRGILGRVLGNVQKAIGIITDLGDRYGNTLEIAIDSLAVPENSDNESEQVEHSLNNAVSVMTMHASKGLEFPIVILAGMNVGASKGFEIQYTSKIGYSAPMPKRIFTPTDPVGGQELPPAYSVLANRLEFEQKDLAETRRLLYVAATRAKDHLILIRTLVRNKDGSFSRKVRGIGSLLNTIHDSLQPFYSLVNPPLTETAITFQTNHAIIDLSKPITETLHIDTVSVTQLLNAHDSHKAGLFTETSKNRELAMDIGSALHWVVANAITSKLGNLSELTVSACAEFNVDFDVHGAGIESMSKNCLLELHKNPNFVSAQPIVEQEVVGTIDKTLVRGFPDLYYQTDDQTMTLWDWKSNSVLDAKHYYELCSHYTVQLSLYALLIFQSHKELNAVGTNLVFANADVEEFKRHTAVIKREDLPEIEKSARLLIDRVRAVELQWSLAHT